MTAQPGPSAPVDPGVTFEIGRKSRHAISVGGLVAIGIGLICFVALIAGAAGGDGPPVGGVIAFVVLGLLFCGFGVLLTLGALSHKRNALKWGERALHVDAAGFTELGNSFGPVFVPWSELTGLEIGASDYGGGYTPYRLPAMPNTKKAYGLMTPIRMFPAHPEEFARRVPSFVRAPSTNPQDQMQNDIVATAFGRAYYTEKDIRFDLVRAIQHYTNGRLGQAVDETRRARSRGSQFEGG